MTENKEEFNIGVPDEEIKEMYAEMAADLKCQQDKWADVKKELKDLIHPKYFDFAESLDTYFHEGIVEIVETDEKQRGYGDNQRNCREKKENGQLGSFLYMHTTDEVDYFYGKQGDYEGESVEYWVWQTVGYLGDDYSGFLLFPLNDGRHWKISYSC